VRLQLNINVRKEKENSLPNAVKTKTKIAFTKDQMNLWSKISTGAIGHLTDSLLDNRLAEK